MQSTWPTKKLPGHVRQLKCIQRIIILFELMLTNVNDNCRYKCNGRILPARMSHATCHMPRSPCRLSKTGTVAPQTPPESRPESHHSFGLSTSQRVPVSMSRSSQTYVLQGAGGMRQKARGRRQEVVHFGTQPCNLLSNSL